MRISFPLAVIALVAGLASAQAQDAPAAPATSGAATVSPPAKVVEPTMVQPTTSAPDVDSMSTNTVDAPLKGANSFTESQARSRIEGHGFSSVTSLMKDSDGIWRGKAMKDGRTMDVALDYKGEVVGH